MPILVVFFQGKEYKRLVLEPDREYFIGRDPKSDIFLETEKGISRQHLKLSFINDQWLIKVVSKYGNLIYEGDTIEELLLDVDSRFSVSPYEFQFYISGEAKAAPAAKTEAPVEFERSLVNVTPSQVHHPHNEMNLEVEGGEELPPHAGAALTEDTSTGLSAQLVAVIKWVDENGKKKGYKLTEGSCVVGRGDGCDIVFKSKLMSRRHFEITKVGEKYHILDLGSANGTTVNNKAVGTNQPVEVESGDRIAVLTAKFSFEVIDSEFNEKAAMVPSMAPLTLDMPLPPQSAGARVVRVSGSGAHRVMSRAPKNKMIRYAIFALVPIVLYLAMQPTPQPKAPQADLPSGSVPFENLSPQDKAVVRDTFNLAKNHFLQNKHALCLAEINKLHKIIPFYENSKEIEGLCAQALDLEQIQIAEERKRKEQEYIHQRIQVISDECKAKIAKFNTLQEAKECIGPALDLDPENAMVTEFLTQVEMREQEKRSSENQKAAYLSKVHLGESKYREAQQLFQGQRLREAIQSYEEFLKANLPDPKNYKEQAKRDLAAVKTKLEDNIKLQFNDCKKNYNERKFKDSINACILALREDPENTQVNAFKSKVLSELRKEMKLIYEDSILEENLGNVDAAKEKWKKILEQDVVSDDYFKKAKNKLKKYGIGI